MPGGTLESEIFGSDDEDDEEAEEDEEYAQGQMSDDEDWYEPPSEEVADDTPELHTQDQDQDSQEPEVAVVVDGHTNADQIEYTAPKAPFLGTIWNGLLNGFPRVNQNDTSAPRGQRPTGYVWSVAINGWRRTLAQTLLDEQRIAEQYRNRTTRTTAGAAAILGADVPNATLSEISWYVVAIGTHAPRGWFTLLSNAWKSAIETSGDTAKVLMSYERGERKENGHIQGIARILTHISLKERIRRWMRASLMVGQGAYRVKIGLVFFTGQDWTHMGGYVQKDHGLPHYLFYCFPQLSGGAFLSSCLSCLFHYASND